MFEQGQLSKLNQHQSKIAAPRRSSRIAVFNYCKINLRVGGVFSPSWHSDYVLRTKQNSFTKKSPQNSKNVDNLFMSTVINFPTI